MSGFNHNRRLFLGMLGQFALALIAVKAALLNSACSDSENGQNGFSSHFDSSNIYSPDGTICSSYEPYDCYDPYNSYTICDSYAPYECYYGPYEPYIGYDYYGFHIENDSLKSASNEFTFFEKLTNSKTT